MDGDRETVASAAAASRKRGPASGRLVALRRDGVRWRMDAGFAALLHRPGTGHETNGLLPDVLEAGRAAIVSSKLERKVYRVDLAESSVYLKHYAARGWWGKLLRGVSVSNARREWRKLSSVRQHGFRTAVPLACGVAGGLNGDAFLVTEEIAGARSLLDLVGFEWGEGTLGVRSQELAARQHSNKRTAREGSPRFAVPALPSVSMAALARRLGEWVARLHAAGIEHRDLHPGNILFDGGGETSIAESADTGETAGGQVEDRLGEPILIDYQAVRVGRPLGWRRSRSNLALFDRSFTRRLSAFERLRFLHAYLKARGRVSGGKRAGVRSLPTFRRAAEEIGRASWRSCLRFWRRRDRRCLRAGKYYRVSRTAGAWSIAVRELPAEIQRAVVRDPDRLFASPDAVLLKRDSRSTVACTALAGKRREEQGRPRAAVWKRYHRSRKWFRRLLGLFRRGRAWNAWKIGGALVSRGIPTPRPLMLLARRRRLMRDTYLMTEQIPDAVNLADYVRSRVAVLPPASALRAKRQLIDQLAAQVGWLHRCGFNHRDLKAVNLLVTDGLPTSGFGLPARWPETCSPKPVACVYLIDLDAVRLHRRLSFRRRVQNLSRLHASFHDNSLVGRTDKLRFLRRYLAESRGDFGGNRLAGDWKSLWRAIDRRTRRKLAQNRRRGRMLT